MNGEMCYTVFMKTISFILFGLLAMSSLMANETKPQATPPSEKKPTLSDEELMTLRQDARCKQVLTPALVNGQPLLMLIDTGATHTVLHTESAEKLKGLHWIDTSQMQFNGNSKQSIKMALGALQVGPGQSPIHPLMVLDLSGVRSMMHEKVDGIVGMDMLNSLPYTFNFKEKSFNWGVVPNGELVPLTGDRDPNARLFMDVKSGEATFKLLLDTGSTVTKVHQKQWAPGVGEAIAAQISDVDAAAEISATEGKKGVLQLAKDVDSLAFTPLLCPESERTVLGLDALAEATLIHIPSENQPHGTFFVVKPKATPAP